MGNTHKSDKNQAQDNSSSADKKHSSSHSKHHEAEQEKAVDGEAHAHAHAEQKKAVSEPKREPKNVTITDIELEKLKNEATDYKDKYLRVLAESENARKRLQKEKQEMIQYALQNVIVDFLNPIDHMENALKYTQQMSEDVKNWAIGFQMILTQFKDVLTNNGVFPFDSEGKPFDHNYHEAIEVIDSSEVPPNTVINESLKGYKMGDRIIRPARVKVAKAPAEENNSNEQEDQEEE